MVRLLYDNQSATRPNKVRCRVEFVNGSQEIGKEVMSCPRFYSVLKFKHIAENIKKLTNCWQVAKVFTLKPTDSG